MCSGIKSAAVRTALRGVCVALLIAVGGCVGDPAPAPSVQAAMAMQAASAIPLSRPYVLRANDRLHVVVYNEPTISGDYQIDGTGSVSIPLAGRVKAAGLTTTQLERSITHHLDGSILKDAHISVQIAGYGPFFIRGEVKQPGQFPYAPGLTIGDAVALAGGYTYRADETAAYVRPAGSPVEITRSLRTDVPVAPGDNIRIPERYF